MRNTVLILSFCLLVFSCQNESPQKQPAEDTQSVKAASNSSPPKDTISWGSISGHIVYPTDAGIPEDYRIAAFDLESGEVITCRVEDLNMKNYTYELRVKPGKYYVYSFLISSPDQRAYYDEFVTCGLKYECKSHEKIAVTVNKGETKKDIDPADWYELK